MIDWDKPLETEGGRPVTVLAKDVVTQDLHGEAPSVFVRIHNTFSPDVVTSFKMDADSKTICIRNIAEEREGWAIMLAPFPKVFQSEKEARDAAAMMLGHPRVVHMKWEE